jgi:PadR family transcriptional regulator AphA
MARTNRTRQVVLGFLTWRPMSGYEIKQSVEESVSFFWSESYGQIYPTLHKLAEEDLVKPVETPMAGGRERQLYAITPKGRKELHRWLEGPTEPTPQRNELLLKLFFAHESEPQTALRQLEAHRRRLLERLDVYEIIEKRLKDEPGNKTESVYWRLTLRHGLREKQAQLDWCNEAIETLENLMKKSKRFKSNTPRKGVFKEKRT